MSKLENNLNKNDNAKQCITMLENSKVRDIIQFIISIFITYLIYLYTLF